MLKLFNTTKNKNRNKFKTNSDYNTLIINNINFLHEKCKKCCRDISSNIESYENIYNEKKYCDVNSFHMSNNINYNYTKRYSYKNLDELIRHRDLEYRYFNTIEIVIHK